MRDVLLGRRCQHRLVRPVGDVEGVLQTHRGDPLCLGQLVEADRAEAKVPDQALLLRFGQRLELGVSVPGATKRSSIPAAVRRLTTSSTSSPSRRRLSCTCSCSD
jgi:hypothetical protein